MTRERRELMQTLFVSVCRDSGFQLDAVEAATMASKVLGAHPLELWRAMPSLSGMDEIAAGRHAASRPR